MCECNITFFHFFWCFCLLIPSSSSLFYSVGEGLSSYAYGGLEQNMFNACRNQLSGHATKFCVLHVEIDSLGVLQKLCVASRNWCVILFCVFGTLLTAGR